MSFLSILFGRKNETSNKIEVLNTNTFADAIRIARVQLVDVRTPNEYRGGHIKSALNIDFFNKSNFDKAFDTLNKNEPIYLYCRSGARSQKAARRLAGMGFSKIYDLKGGYLRWN